jgi:hypothetical protein
MDDKEVLKELKDLKDSIEKKEKKSFFEKMVIPLLVPLVLGVIAYIADRKGTEIAEAQLELTRLQEERLSVESENNLQLKYLDLFYNDITSNDPEKHLKAASLLGIMNEELRLKLTNWVLSNKQFSQDVRDKAEESGTQKPSEGYLLIANYFCNSKKWGFGIRNTDNSGLKGIADIKINKCYVLDKGFKGASLKERKPPHYNYNQDKLNRIDTIQVLPIGIKLEIIEAPEEYGYQSYKQYWAKVRIVDEEAPKV